MIRPLPLLALFAALPAADAQASALRWEPAANGAAIVLPAPTRADGVSAGIAGGSLFCRNGEWAFLLRTERAVPAGAKAIVGIGADRFEAVAKAGGGTVEIAVPTAALAPLKDGAAVTLAVGEGENALSARFPLAGSRAAIEAAAPLCSAPAVPGFEAVGLEANGSAATEASVPAADEAALFQAAAGKPPTLAAARLEAEGGKALLFASLCGSNRYYGETGCKLMGFARETADGAWKPVLETEGMQLFRNPRLARNGWPDLLTLSPLDASDRLSWSWQDGAYAPGPVAAVAEDSPAVVDELRTGTTEE